MLAIGESPRCLENLVLRLTADRHHDRYVLFHICVLLVSVGFDACSGLTAPRKTGT